MVAETILHQLGGRMFLFMTGSYQLVKSDNLFGCKLRRNNSGCNYLRIKLTPMDTYTMEFISIRGMAEPKVKHKYENIYADQLQTIFTQVTGLYTRL